MILKRYCSRMIFLLKTENNYACCLDTKKTEFVSLASMTDDGDRLSYIGLFPLEWRSWTKIGYISTKNSKSVQHLQMLW